jgi:hypothetical protein
MASNYYWIIYLLFHCAIPCFAQSGNTSSANNIRSKVKKTYISQIGIRELTGNNDGEMVETYLHYVSLSKGNPWCAAFVCWALGQNKVYNPHSGYCPDLFSTKNIIYQRTRKNNATPMPSDVFGIYFPERGRIAHVGFIESWTSTTATTVEGNTNQAGSREGDGVYRKIRLTRQIYAVARFIK